MKLEDIYNYYKQPQPTYLNQELAVCYVLSVLLEGDSYGTELINRIEHDYPNYRLSDTVLYAALKFLEDEDCISGTWKKVQGRGRPRRMYQLTPKGQEKAVELTKLWQDYMSSSQISSIAMMQG